MKRIFLSLLLSSALTAVFAQSEPELARSLIDEGRLAEAHELLDNSTSKNDLLLKGRLAFLEYDFDEARRLYSQYRRTLKKSDSNSELELFENQLDLAENALERVEKIQIIDEIEVDADTFFKAYRLPISAGRLTDSSEIPFKEDADDASMTFVNEKGNFMMWSRTDENGMTSIVESSRLTDGSWEEPTPLPDMLGNGGNVDYPFMMADGTTLYFASDGEDSMGGYDIFIAGKDLSTGEYRQPQNMGMPYNSPFDDYMLAIDEENGIGWWASDRNLIPGQLTVYVFLVNDMRVNHDPDNENIIDFASLKDTHLTVEEDTDLDSLKRMIREIKPGVAEKEVEFIFPVAAGLTYTSMSDFKSSSAASMMKKYMADKKALENDIEELKSLRVKYHESNLSGRNALSGNIKSLETKVEENSRQLNVLRGKIISTEKGSR